MDASMDFLANILEEIALEGLDGITFSSLCIRLENRPHFSLALDDDSKSFIWECVAVHKAIEMYELPVPRPLLVIHDRFQYLDSEFGLVTEPECKPVELYPINIIDDGPVRGSSQFYSVRKQITPQIRHGSVLLMSFGQVAEEWGEKLVLVASPSLRWVTLLGTEANPLMEVTKDQYCLLERIGRARYHGEVTQGESGLLLFKSASIKDNLHYHLSKLLKKGLITKQKHILRSKTGKTTTGVLLHLTRFYVQRKIKCDSLLEFIYHKLKDKPNNREESRKLQQDMGIPVGTFRKLLKRFAQKWFRVSIIPYSEMYPDDTAESGLHKNGEEKLIKVIQMIRPYVEDEVIDEEDEEEDSNVCPYFDPSKVHMDKPLLCQAYKVIADAGPNGTTLGEVRKALTLPRLDIRGLCRLLIKKNKVITVMHEKGRQRYESFIAKKFESESMSCINIREQANQFNQQQDEEVRVEADDPPISSKENSIEEVQPNLIENEVKSAESNKEVKFANIRSQIILDNSPKKPLRTPSLAAAVSPSVDFPDRQISARLLKRANILTGFLKHSKVSTITELMKIIRSEERKEGYKYEVDKRSVIRLVTRLSTDNRTKVLKAILKQGEVTKELEFVCHPTLETSDIEFKTAIEQAKFQHFSVSRIFKKDVSNILKNAFNISKSDSKENIGRKMLLPTFARQLYGLQPKFSKTKALHLFLCYLVYHYDGQATEEREEPFVYNESGSWKRFVPPLPKYKEKGWFILSDAISRMPLSIFVKMINLRYEIPNLEETLKDSNTQQSLIKHLSQDLRNNLLGDRKYLFSISDILHRLCYMGLVSFGPKLHFQKDQVYIYIHQYAQIKDTSMCSPGYIHIDSSTDYHVRKYHFQKLNDVENYWIDLETTCLHTLLGKYGTAAGQKISVWDPNQKPELMETLRNREFKEISDIGTPPGDGLGAAGLDSSLFAHLRRNWIWPSSNLKVPVLQQKQNSLSEQKQRTMQYLLEVGAKKFSRPESRVRLQRLTKKVLGPSKKRPSEQPATPSTPSKKAKIGKKTVKKKTRIVRMKAPKRQRRPFYDEKDKAAMGSMNKMRVDWTAQEDSLLLMCKVTSMFLDPKFKAMVVPYTFVRDVLNDKFPSLSANKTSRACQRRLRHMLISSEESRNSVGVFLGEAKQDAELVKEFDIAKPPKTKEDKWQHMFTTLLDKLLNKFTSMGDYDDDLFIPDSIQELKSQFNIVHPENVMDFHCQYQDAENDSDIYHTVIASVILSSLSSMGDCSNWSYTLYKIYEQYPDNLLHAVLDQFYKKRLITKKLSYKRPKFANNEQASSVPYRYSVTYENCFLIKYPVTLFAEAKEFIEMLKQENVQLLGNAPAGYVSALIPLIMFRKMTLHTEIPEQIIVFNVSVPDTQNSTMVEEIASSLADEESTQSENAATSENTTIDTEVDQAAHPKAKRLRLDTELIKTDFPEAAYSTSTITMKLKETEDSVIGLQNISFSSRLAFYMLHQQLEYKLISPDDVSINTCQLTCKLTSDVQDISLSKCHLIPNDVDAHPSLGFKPNTSMNGLLESIVSNYTAYIPLEFINNINHLELLKTIYQQYASNETILQNGKEIFLEICSANNIGVLHHDIWRKYQDLTEMTIFKHLSLLMESKLILRVGIANFRYVGIMHSRIWLLSTIVPIHTELKRSKKSVYGCNILSKVNIKEKEKISDQVDEMPSEQISFRQVANKSAKIPLDNCKQRSECATEIESSSKAQQPSEYESLLFVPRTWRKPDGTLNRPVLVNYLKTVLGHIMSCPSITEEKICERFSLPLQPVCVMELLDMLERARCIYRYYQQFNKPVNLFSNCNRRMVTLVGQPGDQVHYESHADAPIKLNLYCDFILSHHS